MVTGKNIWENFPKGESVGKRILRYSAVAFVIIAFTILFNIVLSM